MPASQNPGTPGRWRAQLDADKDAKVHACMHDSMHAQTQVGAQAQTQTRTQAHMQAITHARVGLTQDNWAHIQMMIWVLRCTAQRGLENWIICGCAACVPGCLTVTKNSKNPPRGCRGPSAMSGRCLLKRFCKRSAEVRVYMQRLAEADTRSALTRDNENARPNCESPFGVVDADLAPALVEEASELPMRLRERQVVVRITDALEKLRHARLARVVAVGV
eukprot:6201693-Pleurochrysis_carterae.AAC.5